MEYVFSNPKIGDFVVFSNRKRGERFIKRIQKIKKGTYFCIGDNTDESMDSRVFGWIDRHDILGKVICIL